MPTFLKKFIKPRSTVLSGKLSTPPFPLKSLTTPPLTKAFEHLSVIAGRTLIESGTSLSLLAATVIEAPQTKTTRNKEPAPYATNVTAMITYYWITRDTIPTCPSFITATCKKVCSVLHDLTPNVHYSNDSFLHGALTFSPTLKK